jgi:hypothetical protein
MLPLANLPNIRFLDLSYNSISRVEGLETLTKLQHLSLEANNISSAMGIRPLSMNKELTTLVLAGNPFSMTPQYKPMLLNTIPSLITLDGHMLPQRKKLALSAHKNGYVELFDESKYHNQENNVNGSNDGSQSEADLKLTRLTQGLHTTVHAESVLHHYYDGSDVAPIILDGDSTAMRPSNLPWRNPPNPMPRQLVGKPMVGSIPTPNTAAINMNTHNSSNSHHHHGVSGGNMHSTFGMTFNGSLGGTFSGQMTRQTSAPLTPRTVSSSSARPSSTGKMRPTSATAMVHSPTPSTRDGGTSETPRSRMMSPSAIDMSRNNYTTASSNRSRSAGRYPGPQQHHADHQQHHHAGDHSPLQPKHPHQHMPAHLQQHHQQQQRQTPSSAGDITRSMRDALRRSSIRGMSQHPNHPSWNTNNNNNINNNFNYNTNNNFYYDHTNKDPKEPVKWMTPKLTRIARGDKDGRKQERAIVDMMDRIGLPEEMNTTSKFWATRVEKGQVPPKSERASFISSGSNASVQGGAGSSSKNVQFTDDQTGPGDSLPPPQRSRSPSFMASTEASRRASITGGSGSNNSFEKQLNMSIPPPPPPPLPYQHQAVNNPLSPILPRTPDKSLMMSMDEMSDRIIRLKAETQHRMELLRSSTKPRTPDGAPLRSSVDETLSPSQTIQFEEHYEQLSQEFRQQQQMQQMQQYGGQQHQQPQVQHQPQYQQQEQQQYHQYQQYLQQQQQQQQQQQHQHQQQQQYQQPQYQQYQMPPQQYAKQVPSSSSSSYAVADDHSTMDMSEATQPIYSNSTSSNIQNTINGNQNSADNFSIRQQVVASPPPPPPPLLDPAIMNQSKGFYNINNSAFYQPVAQPQSLQQLRQEQQQGEQQRQQQQAPPPPPRQPQQQAAEKPRLTVATELDPSDPDYTGPGTLSNLINPVLENANKLASLTSPGNHATSADTPIIIEGYHVASAIDDLMARKHRTLKMIEEAKRQAGTI